MKSYLALLQEVLASGSTWCRTSTIRDWKTITDRSKKEGLSFLTITLPKFCSDFERSLDQGFSDPSCFRGFSKQGELPRFLGGFLDQVFDRPSGRLLDKPDIDCIRFIRQITLMHKKVLLPCSISRSKGAFDAYVKCEQDVVHWTRNVSPTLLAEFDSVSDLLWGNSLSIVDREVHDGDLVPRHGPGATADKLFGNEKFDQSEWPLRLSRFFAPEEYLIPNWGFGLDRINILEPGAERPVRVIQVPKTLKTPRIIAIEPTAMQYAQQALLASLVSALEGSDSLSNSIGFTDQTPNQHLACESSSDGSLATIDLSEASDRVSNLLVKRMLRNFPSLKGAVNACRSRRADVPGHGVIRLVKFASMGSATCFPIEAMVFLTVITIGYARSLSLSLNKPRLQSWLRKVRVYGDDIIVPVNSVQFVVDALEDFGLKVNKNKSFWTGKFRESCGKDYYDGHDVSVVYVRRRLPSQRNDVSEMISAFSLRNQLYKVGIWRGADFLDRYLSRFAPVPNVLETSPVLGRHSFLGYSSEKMCPTLHRPLVRGFVVSSKSRPSPISGEGALLKFFLKRGPEPYFDVKHLERYGRPESVDIKIRWGSPV